MIGDHERLQKKFDMLLVRPSVIIPYHCHHSIPYTVCLVLQVLGDIELAQGLERDQEKKQKKVPVLFHFSSWL